MNGSGQLQNAALVALMIGGTCVLIGGICVLIGGTCVLIGGMCVLIGGTCVLIRGYMCPDWGYMCPDWVKLVLFGASVFCSIRSDYVGCAYTVCHSVCVCAESADVV